MHNTLMTANNQGSLWQWKSVCFAEVTVVPSDCGNFSLWCTYIPSVIYTGDQVTLS